MDEISPENSMTFADLSNVQSTSDLINEIIEYLKISAFISIDFFDDEWLRFINF